MCSPFHLSDFHDVKRSTISHFPPCTEMKGSISLFNPSSQKSEVDPIHFKTSKCQQENFDEYRAVLPLSKLLARSEKIWRKLVTGKLEIKRRKRM
mmetsp:Transcript_27991/g.30980  ORF Transcript_27991/g.30980 Transcript_27991/m.30980 type:complete len:95 (-) Transcript_27991:158-442(-)